MARRTPREPKRFTSTQDMDTMRKLFGFTIESVPTYIHDERADAVPYREVQGKRALVRTDTFEPLGVVSPRYGIIQPRIGLDIMEACGDLQIVNAGSIGNGQRMYVQAIVKGAGFDVAGQEHQPYLFLGMHNDGSGTYFVGFTPTRCFCWNQLRAALKNMLAKFAIRHTGNAQERAEVTVEVIRRARAYFGEFHQQALALVAQRFSVQDMRSLCEELWPTPKAENLVDGVLQKRATVVQLFVDGKLNHGIHGTKYGALNAVAEFIDHGQNRQGGDAGKVNALLFGHEADRLKQAAWDRLAA